MNNFDFFIFAGEPSGDLHGSSLIASLYAQDPSLKIAFVGGPKMRKSKAQMILPMEKFCVMGFLTILPALPRIIYCFFQLSRFILQKKPKVVVFIDYPGFTLRLEKHLRKKGFKGTLVHYISPSVWAHGKHRILLLEKNVDLLLSIFPFEKKHFSPSFPIRYVGHPLIHKVQNETSPSFSFPKDKQLISLFPGSRLKEIELNLPLQLETFKSLQKENPSLICGLSIASNKFIDFIKNLVEMYDLTLGTNIYLIPEQSRYPLMKSSCLAIAKSGTVTLELALLQVPSIVVYKIRPIDLFIARNILKINLPFYCIVNILAEKEVFPEFIGPNATTPNLIEAAKRILFDSSAQKKLQEALILVRKILGELDASDEAAKLLIAEKRKDQAPLS